MSQPIVVILEHSFGEIVDGTIDHNVIGISEHIVAEIDGYRVDVCATSGMYDVEFEVGTPDAIVKWFGSDVGNAHCSKILADFDA